MKKCYLDLKIFGTSYISLRCHDAFLWNRLFAKSDIFCFDEKNVDIFSYTNCILKIIEWNTIFSYNFKRHRKIIQKAQKNYRRLRKLKIKHWKFYLNLIKKFKIDVLKKKNYHFTSTSTTFCIHCFKKFEIVINYPIILFPVFNPNIMENIHMIYFLTPIKYY